MKVVRCVFLSNFPLHNHHSSCTGSQLLFPLSHNTICNIQTKSTKIVTNQTNRTNSIIFNIFSISTLEKLYDVSFVIHYNMNEKIKKQQRNFWNSLLRISALAINRLFIIGDYSRFSREFIQIPTNRLKCEVYNFESVLFVNKKLLIRSPNFRHGIWIDLCRVWLSINYVYVWAIGSNRRNE